MTETAPERIWAKPLPVKVVCYGEYDLDDESGGEEYVHHSLLDEAVKALEPFAAKVKMPTIDPRGLDVAGVSGRANNDDYRRAYATLAKIEGGDMTNANALPIQVATDETVSMAHYNAAMGAKDARIDALEKALELADARFHMHGMATMTERLEEYGYEHEAQVHGLEDYRAALGEGE